MDYLSQLSFEAKLREMRAKHVEQKKELMANAGILADLHGEPFLVELQNFLDVFTTCNPRPKGIRVDLSRQA